MEHDEILTVTEVARELRCSKAHVCKAINGRVKYISALPAIAMGRRKLVRRSALERWIGENERRQSGDRIMASPNHDAVDA